MCGLCFSGTVCLRVIPLSFTSMDRAGVPIRVRVRRAPGLPQAALMGPEQGPRSGPERGAASRVRPSAAAFQKGITGWKCGLPPRVWGPLKLSGKTGKPSWASQLGWDLHQGRRMLRGAVWLCIYSFLLKILELLTVLVGRTMVLSEHTSDSRKLWLSYLTCNRDFTDVDEGTGLEVGWPRHQLGQSGHGCRRVEGCSCCGRERCVRRSRAERC